MTADCSFGHNIESPVPGFCKHFFPGLRQDLKHTLVSSIGDPKLSSVECSPVKMSEGSRGEDGISGYEE